VIPVSSKTISPFFESNGQAPPITSAAGATFTVGNSGGFTITATGSPTPSLAETGALPAGLNFTDNGNGTATLAGIPGPGSAGSYPLTFRADNGVPPDATQTFTLTVSPSGQAPAITSAAGATFSVGSTGHFTIMTTGTPAPSLTETGALPDGVTFTNNGDGTATLTGTPAVGSGKVWTFTITASNGVIPDARQTLALTVNEAPTITSPATATFTAGSAGHFTVTTAGFPAPSLLETGALPGGVTFIDNGNGTATLTGAPAPGSGSSYPFTIMASNGAGSDAVQDFSLVVSPAPPTVPVVEGITAQLVVVKVGKKKRLVVEVLFAETGALKDEFPSPFQKPAFKNVQVSVRDSNGDGVPDQVVLTAKKGKRAVSTTFGG
jgi:hypothetical protein